MISTRQNQPVTGEKQCNGQLQRRYPEPHTYEDLIEKRAGSICWLWNTKHAKPLDALLAVAPAHDAAIAPGHLCDNLGFSDNLRVCGRTLMPCSPLRRR